MGSKRGVGVCAQLCLTLCDPMDCSPPGFFCLWNFPGKYTEVDCHFLLQGIFLAQALNLCLLFPALAGRFFTTETPRKPLRRGIYSQCQPISREKWFPRVSQEHSNLHLLVSTCGEKIKTTASSLGSTIRKITSLITVLAQGFILLLSEPES